MKITLEQISLGIDEIIIRYQHKTPEIERIISYIEQQDEMITVTKDGQQFRICPQDVVYLESVDGNTFLYTENEVYRSTDSLAKAEVRYGAQGFFRCSKSMVMNICRIQTLKSQPGNRIDAGMDNGEHVVISRRYAKELRRILKGGEA